MGTLVGHLFMGLFLLVLGGWHLYRTMVSYIRSPRDYAARAWHPVACCGAGAKHLELYLLLAILPAAVIYELLVSTDFQSLVKIGFPIHRIIDLQYTALLLGFSVLALAALLADRGLQLPQESSFLIGSVLFALEAMILSRQSQDLEAKCESILGILALVCSASSGLLAAKPKAFIADLLLSGGTLLQGSWLLQTAFSLYVDAFIPQGCHKLLDLPRGIHGSTKCELDEARSRASALIDLAFVLHVLVAIVAGLILFCGLSRSHRRRGGGYDSLSLDAESSEVPLKPIAKQAQC